MPGTVLLALAETAGVDAACLAQEACVLVEDLRARKGALPQLPIVVLAPVVSFS